MQIALVNDIFVVFYLKVIIQPLAMLTYCFKDVDHFSFLKLFKWLNRMPFERSIKLWAQNSLISLKKEEYKLRKTLLFEVLVYVAVLYMYLMEKVLGRMSCYCPTNALLQHIFLWLCDITFIMVRA